MIISSTQQIFCWEYFFHVSYGIFILKRLPALDICNFKTAGAFYPEPKQMKYFIICATSYIGLLQYYCYLVSRNLKSVYLKRAI